VAGASIDDEWGELIGDELSGPRPIGPTAKSHDAVGVPEPLEAEPEPDESLDAVPVPKKKATPGKAVVPPPPRLGARSPERRTDSVLAVPRDASSSRSGMRRVSKKDSSSSGRFATRRMLVPAPPKPEPKIESDELPITVDDGVPLPDVPSWGGQRGSMPTSIPPTLVPAATDELALLVSEPADPSGTLDLKSVSQLVPKTPEPPQEVAEEDSDVISVEPVPVRDSDVIEVSPAVPKTVTEAVPRVVSDLAALAEREELESDEGPKADGVPEFGALDDVVVDPPSRPAKFEPALAMTATGGWKPLMPWILGSAALLLLGSLLWMSDGATTTKEQTEVAASAVAKASESSKAAPTTPGPAKGAEPKEDSGAASAAAPLDEEPAAVEPAQAQPAEAEPADEPAEDEPAADEPAEDEPAADEPAEAEPAAPEIPAVDPDAAKRYADASAQYDSTNDQESLEMMAMAACAMDDGVKARSAFRKLVGGDRRGRVMIDCRKRSVDVTAKGDEPTPEEILRQAERALAAGDPDKAEELARASNRVERSQPAILLTAVAACAGGRVDRAVSLRRHLSSANRKTLKARCPGLPES